MNAARVRVGIVGAGSISTRVSLPNLLAIPGVDVVAVCNSRIDTARRVAEEFAIAEVVENWTSLIDRNDLDVIWIGTPPLLHAPVSIAALDAGKHVFCQARMSMDLAEARSMLAAAQRHPESVAMLCPPPHGMKAGRLFRQLLNDGYVGEPYHFRLLASDDLFADPSAPPHWRQRREISGLNALTVGIYAEVLHRWLGPPSRLHALTRVCVPDRAGYTVQVPDVVQVAGEWSGGVIGSMEWSGVSLFAPDSTLTLYGRDGTLEYNFATDQVRGARRGDDGLRCIELSAELASEWTAEQSFITAVRDGGHPQPSFETGVAYMEFTEAVHVSARIGAEVRLPLP